MQRYALSGPTMGSRWSVIAHAADRLDTGALRSALQAAVDRVDMQMSTWKPDSNLNQLNDAAVGTWIDTPDQLADVLAAALAVGKASDGLFNIGVGELVTAWGFGGGRRSADDAMLAAVAGRPTLQLPLALDLDDSRRRARKLVPMRLDLSGIAKGFGVDELGRVLIAFGVTTWLVGIDGELRASGRKPDGRLWAVGHERPDDDKRELMGIIELDNAAIATSGGYRHFRTDGGRRVSHTIDPRSGEPLIGDLASVSVLADSCMVADAWATALLVAGRDLAEAMARRHGLKALLVTADNDVVSTV